MKGVVPTEIRSHCSEHAICGSAHRHIEVKNSSKDERVSPLVDVPLKTSPKKSPSNLAVSVMLVEMINNYELLRWVISEAAFIDDRYVTIFVGELFHCPPIDKNQDFMTSDVFLKRR